MSRMMDFLPKSMGLVVSVLLINGCQISKMSEKLTSAIQNGSGRNIARSPSGHPLNYMENVLSLRGSGERNPAFQKQIKDILIFQSGGWSGLIGETAAGSVDPEWPRDGGKDAYVNKTQERYLRQMQLISELSPNIAIAHLIMPDEEAKASGFGTCWNGKWTQEKGCVGGEWRTPIQQHGEVLYSAWMRGLHVAPVISINNYDCLRCPDRGKLVLPKIKKYLEQATKNADKTTLRNSAGQIVVLLEGLPENTGLSQRDKDEIRDYLNSRSDIFWIDNLLDLDFKVEEAGPNIFRSASGFDRTGGIQRVLSQRWGDRYLWHLSLQFGRRKSEMDYSANKIPEEVRQEWLNISPYSENRYPVVISQWNEYAEFLIFEPSDTTGDANYKYLKWRLSQQR